MREYDVFEGPNGENEAVKLGFDFGWSGFWWAWKEKRHFKIWVFMIGAISVAIYFGISIYEPFESFGKAPEPNVFAGEVFAFIFLCLFGIYFSARVNGWRKQNLLNKGWTIVGERVKANTPEVAITGAKPEMVQENKLVKKALRLVSEGKQEEASLIFERIIRERGDDKNLIDFASKELEKMKESGPSR